MNETLVWIFGAGGPLVILLSIATFIGATIRNRNRDRRAAPRIAAESDSAVVAATKDVVELIRSELKEVIKTKNHWMLRATTAEAENERLKERVAILQSALAQYRLGQSRGTETTSIVNGSTPAEILPPNND